MNSVRPSDRDSGLIDILTRPYANGFCGEMDGAVNAVGRYAICRFIICSRGVYSGTMWGKISSPYATAVTDKRVPLKVPVPFPLSTNVTPAGSAPVSLNAGAGKPVAVTVNEPAAPVVNVAAAALVTTGAWFTVSVKLCAALVPAELLAVMLMT